MAEFLGENDVEGERKKLDDNRSLYASIMDGIRCRLFSVFTVRHPLDSIKLKVSSGYSPGPENASNRARLT